jgi:hypothetical protein
MATTSIADDGIAGSNGQRDNAPDSKATSAALPEYLTGPKKVSNVLHPKSSLSNPYAARSEYTGVGGKQRSENNPPSNAANDRNHPNSGGMGYGAADGKKPKAGVAYNAWDNVGQMHNQYRAPSQTTTLTGSTGFQSRPYPRSLSSGLAKQTSAVSRSRDPTNRAGIWPIPSGQASEWAKPVSLAVQVPQPEHTKLMHSTQTQATRNPPPQFPALSHPVTQNIYEDDDGDSPDEM